MSISKNSLLKHFDARPAAIKIDTIIIHSIYRNTAKDKFNLLGCIKDLNKHKVSAHYIISRRGRIVQLVSDEHRAWHAGQSKMPFKNDAREGVNAFSLGIELIGDEASGFTPSQYQSLVRLTRQLARKHSIKAIIGHNHIAPVRKVDPPRSFDWQAYSKLAKRDRRLAKTRFALSFDTCR